MIDQEEKLRGYLSTFSLAHKKVNILHLKISLIDPALREDHIISSVLNIFHELLEISGQAFALRNDDVFVVYPPTINENAVKAVLFRV